MNARNVRIATVSLNPAIDQTALVPNFTAGTVNRVLRDHSGAAGKGVNVASFLAQAGHDVVVTGLLGRDNDAAFGRLFAEQKIADRFVRLAGATRVNVKIVDEVSDRVTDLNFPGLRPNAAELAALEIAIDELAGDVEWFVLSGSLPAGIPNDIYAKLTARLKARGRTVVLDTSGPPFAAALAAEAGAAPDIIKPNIDELEEFAGRRLDDAAAIVGAARELIAKGVRTVAVSMGPRGAIFVEDGSAVLALPPKTTPKSTVGAGDAMVAGLIAAKLQGRTLERCARLATAYSLAALADIEHRLPPPEVLRALEEAVAVERIEDDSDVSGERSSAPVASNDGRR
jgi:1-phosphofructokinase